MAIRLDGCSVHCLEFIEFLLLQQLPQILHNHIASQVRYDRSNCTKDMRIKFMTDGILLREACNRNREPASCKRREVCTPTVRCRLTSSAKSTPLLSSMRLVPKFQLGPCICRTRLLRPTNGACCRLIWISEQLSSGFGFVAVVGALAR